MKHHEPPFILREMKIELTYRCGLACIHCSSDASPASMKEMTYEDARNIIRQAGDMGVEELAFSGGEPLLFPRITELVSQAAHFAKVTLYTTGICSNLSTTLAQLQASGLKKMIFSLFSHEEIRHERVTRKKGSYRRTLNAIEASIASGMTTEIHFVAMASNYRALPEIVKLMRETGVGRVSVLRFVPQGRGSLMPEEALSQDQYMELKIIVESLRKQGYDIRTGSPFNFLLLSKEPECNAAIDRLIVAPDMVVYPCDAFKQILPTEIAGTMAFSTLANHSLADCWERSPYFSAVREYLTTDFGEPCKRCVYLDDCLSGCLAQKVLTNGSLSKNPDPHCVHNRLQSRGRT